ncbi:toxin [candidate division KSB1 bacterium]|nr:toxin [candidate division KSB1 bacterium]
MKDTKYEWNPDKNELLKKERKISFEQIIFHLLQGEIWKIGDHPDQKKYPGQRLYFVIVNDYIYIVPFIEQGVVIILKTIIPSRKAIKEYRKEIEEKNEIK